MSIITEIESLELVLKSIGKPEFVHDQNRMLLRGVIKNMKILDKPAYDREAVEPLIEAAENALIFLAETTPSDPRGQKIIQKLVDALLPYFSNPSSPDMSKPSITEIE